MNFPNRKYTKKIENITEDKPKKKVWKANMANKGLSLEEMINDTNEYYLNNDIAVIHKKPIPIQVVSVNYPSRNKARITEAYYKTPSTTDYNGVYKGYYIDFDAKECHSLTSFPLKNVHIHQAIHLQKIEAQDGIGFFLVSWNKYNEYYILPIDDYMKFYNESLSGERKSIPYSYFKENLIMIYDSFRPRLDYLKGIDQLIKERNN